MPKFVTKATMSKQFRVFIVPADIQSILDLLRSKVGLRVIEETAPTTPDRCRENCLSDGDPQLFRFRTSRQKRVSGNLTCLPGGHMKLTENQDFKSLYLKRPQEQPRGPPLLAGAPDTALRLFG